MLLTNQERMTSLLVDIELPVLIIVILNHKNNVCIY